MLEFDQIKITMMVLVAELNENINIDNLFPLIPITRVLHNSKKLPMCGIRGAILSARYNGVCRGLLINSYFMNSIIVDVCNGVKNMNVKISRNSMHICGSKSIDMAKDVVELLLNLITTIDEYVKKFKQNNYIEKLVDLTRGEYILVNGVLRNHINIQYIDDPIMNYFIDLARDYVYHDDYVKHLQWINNIDNIISGCISLNKLNMVVVNYGYNLGFSIDRQLLCDNINGFNGFIASYENTLEHKVNIMLPYESNDIKRKKNYHKFIVYKSGFVKQSAPNEEMAREAFQKFIETIEYLKPLIERK